MIDQTCLLQVQNGSMSAARSFSKIIFHRMCLLNSSTLHCQKQLYQCPNKSLFLRENTLQYISQNPRTLPQSTEEKSCEKERLQLEHNLQSYISSLFKQVKNQCSTLEGHNLALCPVTSLIQAVLKWPDYKFTAWFLKACKAFSFSNCKQSST